MMHIIGFLLFGLLIGVLAHMLVPGGGSGGWVGSMAVGVAGSMLGGFFGRIAGLYREGESAGFVMSLLGAFTLVAVYHAFAVRRRAAARTYP
jgi:uncharacterized membrane protein YeaQ/YmgE (transglycosylase-associated protein family)